MKKNNRIFGKILMAVMIIFFYLTIVYMTLFTFNDGKSLTHFNGFSLRWYEHMLESRDMMESLYTTFSIAIIATAISTVAGTIAAIGLSKSKKIVRDGMEQRDVTLASHRHGMCDGKDYCPCRDIFSSLSA